MQHTAHQRPALGIMFVLMSCSSLQFGAAFAVTLFPLFGALAVSVSRLAIASIVVGSTVWLAARWRARRGDMMPPGPLSWSKEQWRAVVIFGLTFGMMNGFFYCAIDRIPIGLAVAGGVFGPARAGVPTDPQDARRGVGPLRPGGHVGARLRGGGW